MTSIKTLWIVSLVAIFAVAMMSATNVAAKDSRDVDSQLHDRIGGNQGGHREGRDNDNHRGNYNSRRGNYNNHWGNYNYRRDHYDHGRRYDDRGRRYYPAPPPTVLITPPLLFPFGR